jgi:hypothetical protein
LDDRVREALHISAHISTSTSTQVVYVEPEVVIHPKPDWKSRYPKDLIPKPKQEAKRKLGKTPKHQRKTRRQIDKEMKIKIIGLLQGVGSQRTQIKVKVSGLLY